MSYELRIRESISLGGKSAASQTTVTGDGVSSKEVSVPAAKTGTLTTRTDDETGELTMTAGHGIQTGDRIDLYWTGGQRRGITVGTVATNQVPIGTDNSGAGDVLPADETAITACVCQEEELLVTGDDVVAIEYYSTKRGIVVLADAADAELTASGDQLGVGSERSDIWCASRNPTSPVAGDDIAKAFFSNGDSTAAATIRVQLLHN